MITVVLRHVGYTRNAARSRYETPDGRFVVWQTRRGMWVLEDRSGARHWPPDLPMRNVDLVNQVGIARLRDARQLIVDVLTAEEGTA